MEIKRESAQELYLFDTGVENIFINEYLTAADGDFVKVYIFALMCAEHGIVADNVSIAKRCGISEARVDEAWTYWTNMGAVKKSYPDGDGGDYDVEFTDLKAQLYAAKRNGASKTAKSLENKELKALYRDIEKLRGKLLGGKEPVEIAAWISEAGATPDVVLAAYRYCVEVQGKSTVNYVGKVVRDWTDRGFRTAEDVDNYLAEMDKRHVRYKRVLTSLGMNRAATEHEKKLMDFWFEGLGFSMEDVLLACDTTSGIREPNINYVDKVLKNKNEERVRAGETMPRGGASADSGTDAVAKAFRRYEMLRRKAETEAAERRLEAFKAIPELAKIEERQRACSMEISRVMVGSSMNKKERIAEIREEVAALAKKRADLLAKGGFAKNYLDVQYSCPICGDTGKTDTGARCSCFERVMKEANE